MTSHAAHELARLEYGAARREHERVVAQAQQRQRIRQSQPVLNAHAGVRHWITAAATAVSVVVSAFVALAVL
jgi:hypothetical protein